MQKFSKYEETGLEQNIWSRIIYIDHGWHISRNNFSDSRIDISIACSSDKLTIPLINAIGTRGGLDQVNWSVARGSQASVVDTREKHVTVCSDCKRSVFGIPKLETTWKGGKENKIIKKKKTWDIVLIYRQKT